MKDQPSKCQVSPMLIQSLIPAQSRFVLKSVIMGSKELTIRERSPSHASPSPARPRRTAWPVSLSYPARISRPMPTHGPASLKGERRGQVAASLCASLSTVGHVIPLLRVSRRPFSPSGRRIQGQAVWLRCPPEAQRSPGCLVAYAQGIGGDDSTHAHRARAVEHRPP